MQPRAIIASVLFASLSGLIFSIHAAESGALQFVQPDLQLGALTNGQVVSITFDADKSLGRGRQNCQRGHLLSLHLGAKVAG